MSLRDFVKNRNVSEPPEAGSAADNSSKRQRRKNALRDARTLENMRVSAGRQRSAAAWEGVLGIYGVQDPLPNEGADDDDWLLPLWPGLNTPPPWRDVTERFKLIYMNRALIERAGAMPFTVRLAPNIFRGVQQQERPWIWLGDRLKRFLTPALGCPIDFWFVMEERNRVGRGALHLHGTLAATGNQKEAAHDALAQFSGKHRPDQLRRKKRGPVELGEWNDEPDGWVWYVQKAMNQHHRLPGRHLFSTQGAKAAGKRYYERERQRMLRIHASGAAEAHIGSTESR